MPDFAGVAVSGFLIFLIAGIICGAACAHIASEKGYGGCSAFFIGFFFSLLGLILYAGLPDKKVQKLLSELLAVQKERNAQATVLH
jgi:hypothetical protein